MSVNKKIKIVITSLIFGLMIMGIVYGVFARSNAMNTHPIEENEKLMSSGTVKVYKAVPENTFKMDNIEDGVKMCFSNDKDVAEINHEGVVKTHEVGLAKIDVYRPSVDSAHEQFLIKVAKKQNITTEEDAYVIEFGVEQFNLMATTDATENNKLTYESDNTNVATVSDNGTVKLHNAGNAKITVIAAESRMYHEAKKVVNVSVKKEQSVIQVDKLNYSIFTDEDDVIINAKSNGKGTLSYESADPNVVTVNDIGKLHPVGEGKTTVTVSVPESENSTSGKVNVSVEVKKPTASDKAMKAVEWAKEISADDSFTYGEGSRAHRAGCYFCGTTLDKKGRSLVNGHSYEKTYCCNPFVFASYAHGAQIPSVLNSCQNGGCGGMKPSEWTPYGFELLGECKNVPFSELLPGDVVMSDKGVNGWRHHVWMYCGDNTFTEASGENWTADSIAVKENADAYYAQYQSKDGCNVVRYTEN